jgi:hypothetical protein
MAAMQRSFYRYFYQKTRLLSLSLIHKVATLYATNQSIAGVFVAIVWRHSSFVPAQGSDFSHA